METNIDSILEGYIDFVQANQKKPASVHTLCEHLHIEEKAFYAYFASIDALEKALWLSFFTDTYTSITDEEVYEGYTVREKLLSFYYTWLEVLKTNRSYITLTIRCTQVLDFQPNYLQDMQTAFLGYAKQLLAEAYMTEEFAERMFIQEVYPTILWLQAKSILHYWIKDKSENFEKTDAYIEKNVNFTCDSFSRSFLDSAFEYFKFIFQG
jgi:AcrR family transcriptional regulator